MKVSPTAEGEHKHLSKNLWLSFKAWLLVEIIVPLWNRLYFIQCQQLWESRVAFSVSWLQSTLCINAQSRLRPKARFIQHKQNRCRKHRTSLIQRLRAAHFSALSTQCTRSEWICMDQNEDGLISSGAPKLSCQHTARRSSQLELNAPKKDWDNQLLN